mgnify:CR=1 FL=1
MAYGGSDIAPHEINFEFITHKDAFLRRCIPVLPVLDDFALLRRSELASVALMDDLLYGDAGGQGRHLLPVAVPLICTYKIFFFMAS